MMKSLTRFVGLTTICLMVGVTTMNAQEKPPILDQSVEAVGGAATGATPPPPPPGAVPPPPPENSAMLLENVDKTAQTVTQLAAYLAPGPVYAVTLPGGETEYKLPVLYENRIVAVLHFDAGTGRVLPEGVPATRPVTLLPPDKAAQRAQKVFEKTRLLDAAAYRARERVWVVPLVYGHEIVGHLRVYYDGIHIVPDWAAEREVSALSPR